MTYTVRSTATMAMVSLAVLLSACGAQTAKQTALSGPPPVGHAFGDSAAFGTRVVAFDREKELAATTMSAKAHVTVLAVVPGRDIEVVVPSRSLPAGQSVLSLARYEEVVNNMAEAQAARDEAAYERCLSAERSRRASTPKKTTRTDSAGRPIYVRGDGAEDVTVTSRCARPSVSRSSKPTRVKLPARPAADRYLVVLTSTASLSPQYLTERLATLTTVASDVGTTIEAIAAGLFLGVEGKWSGYYVTW